MIAKYNKRSLQLGVPGVILQFGGVIASAALASEPGHAPSVGSMVGVAIALVGTVLLWVGLGYYAKAKGHSAALGLLAILGIIGLVILALLSDRARDAEIPAEGPAREDNFIARMSIYLGILGIVPFLALIGVVCGIIGLRRSKDRGSGKVPAMVGLSMSGVFLILWTVSLIAIALEPKPMKPPTRKPAAAGTGGTVAIPK